MFASLRILSLLDKISHNEDYLLWPFVAEEFQVEFEDHLENLKLCAFPRADLMRPDVNQKSVRDGEGEQ